MKRHQNRRLSLALSLALLLGLLPTAALAAPPPRGGAETVGAFRVTGGERDTDYSYANNTLTIMTDTALTIANTDPAAPATDKIVVESGGKANLTLAGVNIDVSAATSACAFHMADAEVALTLADGAGNILKSGSGRAGLEAPAGSTLTIGGPGKLEATGGANGAGIGGGGSNSFKNSGSVTITGGDVTATGGTDGAGIGGGSGGGGSVSITGGSVTATGGTDGAGIGGGYGGGGGSVSITGGDVTATGNFGAGIGGGHSGDGGIIAISGGAITATSTVGAGVGGGGGGGDGGDGGTVTISGGDVTATGGEGAGIGGGGGGANGGNGSGSFTGGSGKIKIYGTAAVTATGGYSTGIGGGSALSGGSLGGSGGEIQIGGTAAVTATGGDGAGIGGCSGRPGGAGGVITIQQNAVVFATGDRGADHIGGGYSYSSGSVTDHGAVSIAGGVIFEGAAGAVYGSVTLPRDLTLPGGLTIPVGSALTIPDGKTLINDHTLQNDGEITGTGTLTGGGDFARGEYGQYLLKVTRAIAPPTRASATQTSVTLNAILPKGDGRVEYARNDTNRAPTDGWNTELTFDGLTAGTTYYFFARVTEGDVYKEAVSTGAAFTTESASVSPIYSIQAVPAALDFGAVTAGDAPPAAQTVTVENTGNQRVTLLQPSAVGYEVGALSQFTLAPAETATFTVQPQAGLAAGPYNGTLAVTPDGGAPAAAISLTFTVKARESGGGGGGGDGPGYSSRTLTDRPTGIVVKGSQIHENAQLTVQAGALHSAWDAGCDLLRAAQGAGRLLGVWDVSLSRGFRGSITVSLPVPGRDGKTLTVAHCAGGRLTLSNVAVKQGFAAVTADSLSPFAVLDGVYTLDALAAPAAGNPFADVKETDWFYHAVLYAYRRGLMNGTGGGAFSPGGAATRAMTAAILYRLEGSPSSPGEGGAFTDVPADAYYADAVSWCAGKGLMAGYGGGRFGPDDPVTREQLVTVLYRCARYRGWDVSAGGDANILSYADASDVSEWAVPAFQWACGAGIVGGAADNRLIPKESATRAQLAAMLTRLLENM